MNIGRAIRRIRKQRGFSQTELSDKTGISPTSLSHIENGVTNPSKRSLNAICRVLDVPEALLYLYGLDESDIPERKLEAYRLIFPGIQDMLDKLIRE